jgi:hypothetical protein
MVMNSEKIVHTVSLFRRRRSGVGFRIPAAGYQPYQVPAAQTEAMSERHQIVGSR